MPSILQLTIQTTKIIIHEHMDQQRDKLHTLHLVLGGIPVFLVQYGINVALVLI